MLFDSLGRLFCLGSGSCCSGDALKRLGGGRQDSAFVIVHKLASARPAHSDPRSLALAALRRAQRARDTKMASGACPLLRRDVGARRGRGVEVPGQARRWGAAAAEGAPAGGPGGRARFRRRRVRATARAPGCADARPAARRLTGARCSRSGGSAPPRPPVPSERSSGVRWAPRWKANTSRAARPIAALCTGAWIAMRGEWRFRSRTRAGRSPRRAPRVRRRAWGRGITRWPRSGGCLRVSAWRGAHTGLCLPFPVARRSYVLHRSREHQRASAMAGSSDEQMRHFRTLIQPQMSSID